MVRTIRQTFFLLFFAVCVVQVLGMASSGEGVRQAAAGPLHDQEQLPGPSDGQTKTDQGESELEEVAFTQADAFDTAPLIRSGLPECASWRQTDFVSDLFRPPTRS
jgi:hypothetical protein